MDEGLPASTHVSLPVSFTELVISCACPLARLKLNDSSNPDPWLLTTKRPSDEELYVLEQATKKAINSSAPAPSSHANGFDILRLISVCGLRSMQACARAGASSASS